MSEWRRTKAKRELLVSSKMLTLVFVSLCLVFVCEGFPMAQTFPVGSDQNPGKSCSDVLEHGGTVTGNYYVRLGGQTLLVYCDQTTAGGGWTLVYSYTFTNFKHFNKLNNAITPRPNWAVEGDTFVSVTPPTSETDFGAMDFFLWNKIGNEFMIKSNINNWISCSDGTGSLVNWVGGTIKCKLVKDVTGQCPDIVPNGLEPRIPSFKEGPLFYNSHVNNGPRLKAYYFLESHTDDAYPTHDPCGRDRMFPMLKPDVPHGNIYIR